MITKKETDENLAHCANPLCYMASLKLRMALAFSCRENN